MTESDMKRLEELYEKIRSEPDECSIYDLQEFMLLINSALIEGLSKVKKRLDALERRIESLEVKT